jgi:hypothetical protein
VEKMTDRPKEIDEFSSQAQVFISWCQSTHVDKTPEQMQRQALTQLSRIYAAGLNLPGVDFVPAPDPPRQTQEERQQLTASLRQLPFQYYWEVFNPTDNGNKTPVCGDLFDDFLDICGDLSAGLWLYDHKHCEAAVFIWNQMFGIHWGRHAASAIHALHAFDPPEDQNVA